MVCALGSVRTCVLQRNATTEAKLEYRFGRADNQTQPTMSTETPWTQLSVEYIDLIYRWVMAYSCNPYGQSLLQL